MASPLWIGCAAGFSGDRTDAAGPVVETLASRGGAKFLLFETLAERTLALAQLARRCDPHAGYEPLLEAMVAPVLGTCLEHRIRIVSNFGAANPQGAARRIAAIARQRGLRAPRIAVVFGDDLSGPSHERTLAEALGHAVDRSAIVSANAYLGAEPIAAAIEAGADVVVCGRVADPSLAVGPAMAHHRIAADQWDRLGAATMAGHLLECGLQVTGGYFADPGFKDVPGLENAGYPVAEIYADGSCVIGKAEATGGLVDLRTVKEQLLYEVHDPAAYLTPDVTADISEARVRQVAPNRVALEDVRGHARPGELKVTVCREGGWLAEAEISYAGPGAESRARLAADVVRRRLPGLQLRIDLVGVVSLFADDAGRFLSRSPQGDARDVRLRVATAQATRGDADRVAREVLALYTCGPAGGGGVRTALRPRLETESCFVPRSAVRAGFEMLEAA